MIKKKKFLFWITQEFEKDLKQKDNIYFINSISALSTLIELIQKIFWRLLHWISINEQREVDVINIIFTDIVWTTLIAMKYHCVSFLAENISKQLCKRKKHWRYIQTMKRLIIKRYTKFSI